VTILLGVTLGRAPLRGEASLKHVCDEVERRLAEGQVLGRRSQQ
jgi:hypothetical protein